MSVYFSSANMEHQREIYSMWDIVRPFYYVLKMFGLAIYSVEGDLKTGRIRTRFWHVLQLMVILSIQIYVLYIKITVDMSLSKTGSVLIDAGSRLVEVFNVFNVVFGTLSYTYYRKVIWRIFRKCHEFDCEVNHQKSLLLFILFIKKRIQIPDAKIWRRQQSNS